MKERPAITSGGSPRGEPRTQLRFRIARIPATSTVPRATKTCSSRVGLGGPSSTRVANTGGQRCLAWWTNAIVRPSPWQTNPV